MVFYKTVALLFVMAVGMGVSIVILAKVSSLLALVPFLATLSTGVWAFAKWGCLNQDEH